MNESVASKEDAPKKDDFSLASPSTGTQEHEDPLTSPLPATSPAPAQGDNVGKSEEPQLKRSITRKKAVQDWMQKAGGHLRTQSASLKARGQKLSEGMKANNKKSKVVRRRKTPLDTNEWC